LSSHPPPPSNYKNDQATAKLKNDQTSSESENLDSSLSKRPPTANLKNDQTSSESENLDSSLSKRPPTANLKNDQPSSEAEDSDSSSSKHPPQNISGGVVAAFQMGFSQETTDDSDEDNETLRVTDIHSENVHFENDHFSDNLQSVGQIEEAKPTLPTLEFVDGNPTATSSLQPEAQLQVMLEIGYRNIDRVVDLSFDKSAASQLTQEELQKRKTEICAICQCDMVLKYDKHCMVFGETCGHLLHAECFLSNVHKKYLLAQINQNYCHVLVPAIICPLCFQCGAWQILESGRRIPDSVCPFAYHRFQDTWGSGKIIMESWITCPILYKALQSKLVTEELRERVLLGNDYNVGRMSPKKLATLVEKYFAHTVPTIPCSICKTETRWDLLKRHMPFNSYQAQCDYKLCTVCYKAELKLVSKEDRKEGRLPCPWCHRSFCFYHLTGQRTNQNN
jgi:hypothetical protein